MTNATIKTGLVSSHGGGVLVGQNEGTVENSYATGEIDGGTSGSNVGGLVGSNLGLITHSYANVAVTGQAIYSYGGLVVITMPLSRSKEQPSTRNGQLCCLDRAHCSYSCSGNLQGRATEYRISRGGVALITGKG